MSNEGSLETNVVMTNANSIEFLSSNQLKLVLEKELQSSVF